MRRIKFQLIKPYITGEEEKEVIKVLRSGWLTQGKYVRAMEEALCRYNKVRHAFLVNSATSGLLVAIKTLDLKKGDEVICPSFTFPATSNSVILGGARPVFCDVDLDTFNISSEKIKKLITKKTKAIMPVSEFGLPADLEIIIKIAKDNNLFIVEDAACALGADIKGKKAGSFGDIGVFSFHPRKIITSGEGGCLITNSSRLAKKIKLLRNHGEYDKRFIDYGYNFRMSDIQAALLLVQFKKIEKIIKKRIELARNYNRLFNPLKYKEMLRLPACPRGYRHIYQSYVILLSDRINRDKLRNVLRGKGIESQIGTHCVPLLDFYKKNFNIPSDSCRNAYFAYKHSLSLPMYHTLKAREQEFIADTLRESIENGITFRKNERD